MSTDKDQADPPQPPLPFHADRFGYDDAGHGSSAVTCSNCGRRIACSRAINPEVGDAALYFCGRRCYQGVADEPRVEHT